MSCIRTSTTNFTRISLTNTSPITAPHQIIFNSVLFCMIATFYIIDLLHKILKSSKFKVILNAVKCITVVDILLN